MSDLISREVAINTVLSFVFRRYDATQEEAEAIRSILDAVPAQPERKRGRWNPHEDEDGEHYGDKCSECGEWYVMPYGKAKYCPNCGADMREVDE